MESVSNNHRNNSSAPGRRGGVPVTKTNKDPEYQVRKMATEWRSRNVALAGQGELLKTRDALVRCGVVVDGQYSAAATLLKRVNQALLTFTPPSIA